MNNDAELGALRAQIEALQQEQELLLWAVTHDFRTPVMTILGFTDILLADQNNPDNKAQVPQYLERIRSAAYRQSEMIGKLQQIVSHNSQPLQRQNINLSALFTARTQALVEARSNVIIEVAPTDNIYCDPEMMKLALSTLLSNAILLSKSASTPKIEFNVELIETHPVFYIRNNGTGFDLGADQTLLALFRRLQAGNEFGDAGIGLVCAAIIIHRHAGKLWVDSQSVHGTTVFFSIPKYRSDILSDNSSS